MSAVPDKSLLEEAAVEIKIDPTFVEKDWYVTQLIQAVTRFDFMDVQMIFTGGTALSKAHKLIKRFSEDTDFRMISNTITQASKSQQRKMLSALRKSLVDHLKNDFAIDESKIISRNDNHFFAFDITYPTVFDRPAALRTHILVECTLTTMVIPPLTLAVSSLFNEVAGKEPEVRAIACTDPMENACDKLSALIWRVADRDRSSPGDDATIVRHLYDLPSIGEKAANHSEFKRLAIDTIHKDDARSEKIKGWSVPDKLKGLVKTLREDPIYEQEYKTFVHGMSYEDIEGKMIDFTTARDRLEDLIAKFL